MKNRVGLFLLLASALPGGGEQATVRLHPATFVTCWQDSTFRGRDIADNDYRPGFFAGPHGPFSGYQGRDVTLTYQHTGGAFRGRIVARGLKPNFSYQMKLVGRPTREFGPAGDDAANERIGRTGRWWRKAPWEGNVYRWDYEPDSEDPEEILIGYLIFDYFVTDRYGNATHDFAAIHSIHAFWERRSRPSVSPTTTNDPFGATGSSYGYSPSLTESSSYNYSYSPARNVVEYRPLARRSSGYGYDQDYPDSTVGIWLEIERFEEGTMVLPPGYYDCRFLLTEESFHQRGAGGYWQSALVADRVRFAIRDRVQPPVITYPHPGETVGTSGTIKGRAAPTQVIRIYSAPRTTASEEECPLATARSGATGRWSAPLRLPPGPHRLLAVAHCGARASAPGKEVGFAVAVPGSQ